MQIFENTMTCENCQQVLGDFVYALVAQQDIKMLSGSIYNIQLRGVLLNVLAYARELNTKPIHGKMLDLSTLYDKANKLAKYTFRK